MIASWRSPSRSFGSSLMACRRQGEVNYRGNITVVVVGCKRVLGFFGEVNDRRDSRADLGQRGLLIVEVRGVADLVGGDAIRHELRRPDQPARQPGRVAGGWWVGSTKLRGTAWSPWGGPPRLVPSMPKGHHRAKPRSLKGGRGSQPSKGVDEPWLHSPLTPGAHVHEGTGGVRNYGANWLLTPLVPTFSSSAGKDPRPLCPPLFTPLSIQSLHFHVGSSSQKPHPFPRFTSKAKSSNSWSVGFIRFTHTTSKTRLGPTGHDGCAYERRSC
jgi:hypothetical protein